MRTHLIRRALHCVASLACSLVALQGCKDRASSEQKSTDQVVASSAETRQPASADVQRGPTVVRTMSGPRIVVDSSASVPRLDVTNDEYVLRLPVVMVRVLFTALPGFTPLKLSAWTPATVAKVVSQDPSLALPSVVLGDFNGDSKLDVALKGNSGQTGASFMLLSSSDSIPTPRILFMNRGKPTTGPADSYLSLMHPQRVTDPLTLTTAVDLGTDAVQYVIIDKGWVLYYLDHGVLRDYAPSD